MLLKTYLNQINFESFLRSSILNQKAPRSFSWRYNQGDNNWTKHVFVDQIKYINSNTKWHLIRLLARVQCLAHDAKTLYDVNRKDTYSKSWNNQGVLHIRMIKRKPFSTWFFLEQEDQGGRTRAHVCNTKFSTCRVRSKSKNQHSYWPKKKKKFFSFSPDLDFIEESSIHTKWRHVKQECKL